MVLTDIHLIPHKLEFLELHHLSHILELALSPLQVVEEVVVMVVHLMVLLADLVAVVVANTTQLKEVVVHLERFLGKVILVEMETIVLAVLPTLAAVVAAVLALLVLPHQVVMVLQELVEMEHHPLLLDLQ